MDRPEERIALIELFERDGRLARSVDVHRWPLTIGRALDNQVVLDDPAVAAHHLRIETDTEGKLRLAVLETQNGVQLDKKRYGAGEQTLLPAPGATLLLGGTRLRLRGVGEVLEPERPLPKQPTTPLLYFALLMVMAAGQLWLTLDPGANYTAWLPVVVTLPLALAGWAGLWALLSKLFQHRFDFLVHLRIALPWLLAVELADALLPQLAAALGWAWLWRLAMPVQLLLLALLVRAHLAQLLPGHRRAVSLVVASVALAGSAVALALVNRATDRLSRPAYMSTLPMPALQWSSGKPPAALVETMAPLAEQLAQRVKQARDDEPAESEAADE